MICHVCDKLSFASMWYMGQMWYDSVMCSFEFIWVHLLVFIWVHLLVFIWVHLLVFIWVHLLVFIWVHLLVFIWVHLLVFIWVHFYDSVMCSFELHIQLKQPLIVLCHDDSLICVPWLIHMCAMTHSYVCHNSCIPVPWLIHVCDMTHSCVWLDSFMCATWLIHVCDMSQGYVTWMNDYIMSSVKLGLRCVKLGFTSPPMCDMTHSYVCHDSFTFEPWLIHMCAMTDELQKPQLREAQLHKPNFTRQTSPTLGGLYKLRLRCPW